MEKKEEIHLEERGKILGYPTPIVNIVGREAAYTTETSQTVLKVCYLLLGTFFKHK